MFDIHAPFLWKTTQMISQPLRCWPLFGSSDSNILHVPYYPELDPIELIFFLRKLKSQHSRLAVFPTFTLALTFQPLHHLPDPTSSVRHQSRVTTLEPIQVFTKRHTQNAWRKREIYWWEGRAEGGSSKEPEVAFRQSWSTG